MQFYKFEGFITDSSWAEENNDRRALTEKTRRIAKKSIDFNNKLQNNGYFFVADAVEDIASIGILCRDSDCIDLNRQIPAFLNAVGISVTDTTLDEVTFSVIQSLLCYASRNSFIEDEDEVLAKFNLDSLCGFNRGLEYGENMLVEANRNDIYAEAKRFLANDTFIPELDRIYAGNARMKFAGHPVHYMLETDDYETRKALYRLLLSSLYANNRIRSKRYVYLDFKSGSRFSKALYDTLYQSCTGGTVVVRYSANDDTEDEYASGGRDTIECLCETMTKYRGQVLTVFCLPRECTKSKDIFYEYLGNTSFIELKEEFASGERAENYLKMIAKEQKIRTDKKLFAALEENKSYLAPDLHEIFDTWYNNKLKTGIYPQYKDIVTAKKEVLKASPKGSAYKELSDMIGLTEAKSVINNAINYYKAQKLFADKGMINDKPAMHMVFTGNPGTAKTSVARLFARIMKENGLLSKGHLIEVGRGDLVGKFVGWTAPTIQAKFRAAQGGVLFIDEAYSLVDDRSGSFGDEAIDTIVQEMENHREDVVVIFAGYPDKMEQFLQKNPGLRSRIAFHLPFADYNTNELCDIARLIAKQKGLVLSDDAYKKLSVVFDGVRCETDFGNGRYVRNVIERAKMLQATRLLKMDYDSITKKDVATICAEDIEAPAIGHKPFKRQIGFCG